MLNNVMTDAAEHEFADSSEAAAADDDNIVIVLLRIIKNNFRGRSLNQFDLAFHACGLQAVPCFLRRLLRQFIEILVHGSWYGGVSLRHIETRKVKHMHYFEGSLRR